MFRDFVTLIVLRKCHPFVLKPLRHGCVAAGRVRRDDAGAGGSAAAAAKLPPILPGQAGVPACPGRVPPPERARNCGASSGAGWVAMGWP